tara:strand:- start:3920 stop:4282 length:363 start_codon:yes stop_codon:yes gene_type:complete
MPRKTDVDAHKLETESRAMREIARVIDRLDDREIVQRVLQWADTWSRRTRDVALTPETTITDARFDTRMLRVAESLKCVTLRDLSRVTESQIAAQPNCGASTVRAIKAKLESVGLTLWKL